MKHIPCLRPFSAWNDASGPALKVTLNIPLHCQIEQEEEHIANRLLKRLDQLKQEKQVCQALPCRPVNFMAAASANMSGPVEACSSLFQVLQQAECPGALHAACLCLFADAS